MIAGSAHSDAFAQVRPVDLAATQPALQLKAAG